MDTATTAMGELLPGLAGLAVRALVLLLVAGALTLALRRATAALRHLVWTTAVAGVLALPALVTLVPDVGVSLPPFAASALTPRTAAGAAESPPARIGTAEAGHAGARAGVERETASGTGGGLAALPPAGGAAAVVSRASSGAGAGSEVDPAGLLVLLWLAGVAGVLAPVGAGWIGVRRLERRCRRVGDSRVAHLATRLALRIGLKREFRLLEGPADAMPMTWGIRRAAVVLPAAAREWSDARVEAVLLHELAHVKRRDCLTQLLAEVVRALHWFDPLAWVAARRLRVEREHACDDVAIAGGARPSAYAGELLGLARAHRASRSTALAAVAMARPGQLAGRLLAVLDEGRRRDGVRRPALVRTAATIALVTVGLAAAAPGAEAGAVAGPGGGVADAGANAVATTATPRPPSLLPEAATRPDPRPGSEAGAAAPLAGAQEVTCAAVREGWKRVQHQSNDERSTILMERPGCELEVRLEGRVEFDADAVTIARMGPDARVRIEEDDGETERFLEIRPGAGGAPSYEYRVDRRGASFDAGAQAWYRAVLVQLFRRAGFAADERVAALLRRGGTEAVLAELGQIESSFVFAKYAGALLEQQRLGEAELRALVRSSARRVDSDHYMSEILGAVADHQPLEGGILDDFIAASATLDSDHYRTGILRRVLESGRLETGQAAAVLASAAELDSDHYLSELLQAVAERYAHEPALREPYLRAASRIDSDHYLSKVLGTLLEGGELTAAERAQVLEATAGIESDHYRSELLRDLARSGLQGDEIQRAYFRAVSGIESDHYARQALRELIGQERLPADLLRTVLDTAPEIESDHYLSELLVEIAGRFPLQGETRDAFLRAMDSVGSDHYRGRVAEALLLAERRI